MRCWAMGWPACKALANTGGSHQDCAGQISVLQLDKLAQQGVHGSVQHATCSINACLPVSLARASQAWGQCLQGVHTRTI